MILQQTMMKMSKTVGGVEGSINKLVLLWEEVGLCLHKSAYMMNGKGYVISHYNTGKIILRNIGTRVEAEQYMEQLAEVLEDWRFTEKEWEEYPSIDKQLIKGRVDEMQKEIYQKGV
jgi:ArsR family metal-binding transcriptional regulator